MGSHLSGRVNRQGFVAKLNIDFVKLLYFIQSDDMSKVPTDQHVDLGDGGQSNMKHIVAETRTKCAMALLSRQDSEDFLCDR
jgi:hypothetical protein